MSWGAPGPVGRLHLLTDTEADQPPLISWGDLAPKQGRRGGEGILGAQGPRAGLELSPWSWLSCQGELGEA